MKAKANPPLRDRVRIERRTDLTGSVAEAWEEIEERWLELVDDFDPSDDLPGDGAGNTKGEFRRVGPAFVRCEVRELEGGETVLAAKLQGTSTCLVSMRTSALVNAITTDERLVQIMPGGIERILNIRHAPIAGRGEYRVFMCEDGVAT
jgi:hypothetical protein